MARNIIDILPQVTVSPTDGSAVTMEQAEAQATKLAAKICAVLGSDYDILTSFQEDARCEHCNHTWTEQGTLYNGGCCGKDEANSPDRLGALQSLIDEVEGGDFWRWDADHGRSRVKVSWTYELASAVDLWLKAGRPADRIANLVMLIRHVKSSDWCTVWSDPGPSGCSLARLPDQVNRASGPEDLATELLSLIDDMGLLPARQAAA